MIELNFTWVHPTIKEEIIEHFKDAYVEHFWNCIEYSQSNGSLLYSCKNSYIKIMSGCLMFAEKGSNSYRHCGMIEQENKKFLLLTKIFDEKENIEMIDSNNEDINKSGFLNLEEGVSIYKNPEDKVASGLKKELSKYFKNENLYLYNTYQENDQGDVYKHYSIYAQTKETNERICDFENPYNLSTDYFYMYSMRRMIERRLDLSLDKLDFGEINHYLDNIMITDY